MLGKPYSGHVRLGYTQGDLRALLEVTGFRIERVRYWKKPGLTLLTLRLSRCGIPGLRTWAAPLLYPLLRVGEKLSSKGYEILVLAQKRG